VSAIFRVVVKHAAPVLPPETVVMLERCWKALVFCLDTSLVACQERIAHATEEANLRTWSKAKKRSANIWHEAESWKVRLDDANTEIAKLSKVIAHYKKDREQFEQIIKDRDEEIKVLSTPPDISNITNMIIEMSNYLDDTEER
jgi:septal ring factor EnvC (AmiA/AmiB activator)